MGFCTKGKDGQGEGPSLVEDLDEDEDGGGSSDSEDEPVADKKEDLKGADRECFELLHHLKAREVADTIDLDDIAEDQSCIVDFDQVQVRYGKNLKGRECARPSPLDMECWAKVAGNGEDAGEKPGSEQSRPELVVFFESFAWVMQKHAERSIQLCHYFGNA